MIPQSHLHDAVHTPPYRRHSSERPGPWQRVIVLANRAPVRHEWSREGGLGVTRSASGVVTALEPIVAGVGGTWVAHATGPADSAAALRRNGLTMSHPASPYRLRFVNLSGREYDAYYYGFSNEALWPLCHAVPVQPVFRADDYGMYRHANRRFAAAVVDEVGGQAALVMVQDYHFALAPRLLQRRLPAGSTILSFWHIPWPHASEFGKCPWASELIDGLLGSDIVGFQTQGDLENFLDTVAVTLDADILRSADIVVYRGHATRVRVYPVGVEWNNPVVREMPSIEDCRAEVYRAHGLRPDVRLGVGVDRLDYTKGIHEKLLAIERLLERHLEWRQQLAFIQVAEPSRERLPEYRAVRAQIDDTARRINMRFGGNTFRPITLLETHHDAKAVYTLYRAADFCYVGSLHDGMNLVAKEFVCARTDHRGVLVLSEFAGAARQLRAAVLVDPYAVDGTAHTLARAITMPPSEQKHRMRLLRANVAKFDSNWWRQQLFEDASAVTRDPLVGNKLERPYRAPLRHVATA
ncbi:MAG TPA: trehalose-6-phosphate synthase [Vicinamibacterales bacterium]